MDFLSGEPWEPDIDDSVHTGLVSFDHQLVETDVDPPFLDSYSQVSCGTL